MSPKTTPMVPSVRPQKVERAERRVAREPAGAATVVGIATAGSRPDYCGTVDHAQGTKRGRLISRLLRGQHAAQVVVPGRAGFPPMQAAQTGSDEISIEFHHKHGKRALCDH